MEFFRKLYDLLRHLGEDEKWRAMIGYVGAQNLYVVLFAIIFAETGLVVTPFLPGDSLLFALGAIGRRGVGINLPVVTVLLMAAAVLGDAVNYWIGYRVGPKVFSRDDDEPTPAADTTGRPDGGTTPPGEPPGYEPWRHKRPLSTRLLNRKHLLRAQEFYEKYGGKTIILARFVPIVRTFAPFVAGIGRMNYFRFALYNVIGGVAWVLVCVTAGYAFAEIPLVRNRFELVIVGIVIVSVLPMAFEYLRAIRKKSVRLSPAAPSASAATPPLDRDAVA